MKPNLNARTQAIVLLLLVGTSGAVAGVVGDRLLVERRTAAAPPTAAPGGMPMGGPWRWEARPDERYGERLAYSLELSSAQRAAIDSIVEEQQDRVQELSREIQPRFRAIADETRASIEDVLTQEQRQRLRALREQRVRAMRPGMREMMRRELREDDGVRRGPADGNGRRGPGPELRPRPPARDDLPAPVRDALREGRLWEYLDSIRGDRPLWQVRDSLLRERGDTAPADRLRARMQGPAGRPDR